MKYFLSSLLFIVCILPSFSFADSITNCLTGNYVSGTTGSTGTGSYSYTESGTLIGTVLSNSGSGTYSSNTDVALNDAQLGNSNIDCLTYTTAPDVVPIVARDHSDIYLILPFGSPVGNFYDKTSTVVTGLGGSSFNSYFAGQPDGEYELSWRYSFDNDYHTYTFYYIGGLYYSSLPDSSSGPGLSTSTAQVLGSSGVEFGLGIIVVILMLFMITYFWNLMRERKYWK